MIGGQRPDDATAFDLTALLDVLSNIIFFLMASFGATIVAVVPAKTPVLAEKSSSTAALNSQKITVTMRVAGNGTVLIYGVNPDLEPAELKPFEAEIAGREGTVDAEQVNEHLWRIKQSFQDSQDLILVPDPDVLYATMIDAMDAAREKIVYAEGQPIYRQLFPAIVVSSEAR